MKVCLVVADGPHKGKEIPIKLPQFIIGRDPQCQLRPASSMISRRHCAILIRQGKVFLRDFGSTNGTLVNDKRVEGEIEIHHSDRLTIDPLAFEVHIEASASPRVEAKRVADVAEDESAALLLEMGESDVGATLSDSGVPEGSTVHQMQALSENEAPVEEGEGPSTAAKKADQVKKEQANTSNAAKLLLEKYARRRRP
jgi:pSer/pThr/pTyr-binding forkhead associated (FHA) protein